MSLLASLNINKCVCVCVLALTVFMLCTGKAHKMEGDIIPESVKGARCQDAHHHPGLLKEMRKWSSEAESFREQGDKKSLLESSL